MSEPLRYYSAETGQDRDQVYRSLAFLAPIGFGLSVLYAGAIVIMAMVSFISGKPFLLSVWTTLVPLAAVLLCVLARNQVRNSDGTLAGESLARWGLLLSVFVCLSYWAYYSAVYFAVRQQARAAAEAWLDLLREGQWNRAISQVIPPHRRTGLRLDDPAVREELEQRLPELKGSSMPKSAYIRTLTNRLIRFAQQNGTALGYELKNVQSWSYTRDGYEVMFNYLLTTPEGEFQGQVTVHGSEARQNEFEGRQWYVDLSKTKISEEALSGKVNASGEAVAQLYLTASEFTRSMPQVFARGDQHTLFQLTLPANEREQARKDIDHVRQAGVVAGVGASLSGWSPGLNRYTEYLDGKLVSVDERYFTDPAERADLLARARDWFRRAESQSRMEIPATMPLRERKGEKLIVRIDVAIAELGTYSTEGYLELEGDARALDSKGVSPSWRFSGLKILFARKYTKIQQLALPQDR